MKQLKDKKKTLFNLLRPALWRARVIKSWHVLRMVSDTLFWRVITSWHRLKWCLTCTVVCHHNDTADTDTWPIRDVSGDLGFWSCHLGWPMHQLHFSLAWTTYSGISWGNQFWFSSMTSWSTSRHGRSIWGTWMRYWASWRHNHYTPKSPSVNSAWQSYFTWATLLVRAPGKD